MEKRRGGVVYAIGEEGGARRQGMKEEKGDDERGGRERRKNKCGSRDGERRNGKGWAMNRERLGKATTVHELTKIFVQFYSFIVHSCSKPPLKKFKTSMHFV